MIRKKAPKISIRWHFYLYFFPILIDSFVIWLSKFWGFSSHYEKKELCWLKEKCTVYRICSQLLQIWECDVTWLDVTSTGWMWHHLFGCDLNWLEVTSPGWMSPHLVGCDITCLDVTSTGWKLHNLVGCHLIWLDVTSHTWMWPHILGCDLTWLDVTSPGWMWPHLVGCDLTWVDVTSPGWMWPDPSTWQRCQLGLGTHPVSYQPTVHIQFSC
jgi:hypothetical protein